MDYEEALELATRMHEGQYRKYTRKPYITHPIAVADKFVDDTYEIIRIDEDCRLVAILHDTIEDTDLTIRSLRLDYGLEEHLIEALVAITRKDETYLDFILRCKRDEIARRVKIEDILHNLHDLEKGSLRDKYIMALYILDIDTNSAYVGAHGSEGMVEIKPFYVKPGTLETSRTPREGFELHPAFKVLQEIRDGADWGEYE